MATLARLTDFVPGTVILSGEVDAEFNQLVNLVNGTTTDKQTFLQLSDNSLATLKINQVVANASSSILSLLAAGVEKIKVDGLGRLHSTVSGTIPGVGNAPFVIASQKQVDNLNVDLLDGLHASEIISQALAGAIEELTLTGDEPCIHFNDTDASQDGVDLCVIHDGTDNQLTLSRDSDSQAIQRWNIDFGTSQFHNIVVLRASNGDDVDITSAVGGSDPDQHLTPKLYVDSKKTQWALAAYYDGVITIGMEVGQVVIPTGVNGFFATHIKAVYTAGTPVGNSTVEVFYRRSGSNTSLGTITLGSGTAVNTVVTNNIADVELLADDQVIFSVTADDLHENVTVTLSGYQKVSAN